MSLPIIALSLSILALIAGSFSLWQTISLNRLRKNFFAGSRAIDLENVINGLNHGLKSSLNQQLVLDKELQTLKNELTFSVQKIGLVKFNQFDDGAGNLSFCLALLDGYNNGVIFTSMHGRQQNRIYAKKISKGLIETPLTEEEKLALRQAHVKFQ